MSSALTLARPYARAAFELARTAGQLAGWSDLLGVAATLAAEPQVAALASNPKLDTTQQVALFLPPGVAADSTFASFLRLLADNGRLTVLPQIAAFYEVHRAEAERTLKVRVRSAAPIEAAQQDSLKAALARRFERSIELDITLEPELLGGAIIDAGVQVIDGSLRGKLARLQTELAA